MRASCTEIEGIKFAKQRQAIAYDDEFTRRHARWLQKEQEQAIMQKKVHHRDVRSSSRVKRARDRVERGMDLINRDINEGHEMIQNYDDAEDAIK